MGAPSETIKAEGWGKIRKTGKCWGLDEEIKVLVDVNLLSQAALGTSVLLFPLGMVSEQDLPLAVPGSRVHYRDFHRVTESGQKERVQTVKLFPAPAAYTRPHAVEGEE